MKRSAVAHLRKRIAISALAAIGFAFGVPAWAARESTPPACKIVAEALLRGGSLATLPSGFVYGPVQGRGSPVVMTRGILIPVADEVWAEAERVVRRGHRVFEDSMRSGLTVRGIRAALPAYTETPLRGVQINRDEEPGASFASGSQYLLADRRVFRLDFSEDVVRRESGQVYHYLSASVREVMPDGRVSEKLARACFPHGTGRTFRWFHLHGADGAITRDLPVAGYGESALAVAREALQNELNRLVRGGAR